MLDTGRRFHPVPLVKTMLDGMAAVKLNVRSRTPSPQPCSLLLMLVRALSPFDAFALTTKFFVVEVTNSLRLKRRGSIVKSAAVVEALPS